MPKRQPLRIVPTHSTPEHVAEWADTITHVEITLDAEPRPLVTAKWARWFAVYEDTYNGALADRAAGVLRSTVRQVWMDDPVFRACRELCEERIAEHVNGEVHRRAVQGVDQGVWYKGERVGTEKRYSDDLLKALAKRTDPDGWGEQRSAAQGSHDGAALVRALLENPDALRMAQALADTLDQARALPQAPVHEAHYERAHERETP